MKNKIYSEVTFKDNETRNGTYCIPARFMFLNETEKIAQNEQLSEYIAMIVNTIDIKYPKCAKIKCIMLTFVDDDGVFICSFKLDWINRKHINKSRVKILDWQNSGYKFKYNDEEDDYIDCDNYYDLSE